MIELYIENRYIELEEDLDVMFTYETLDPDKLASVKNSFSKTVKVPGTPNNNITFGHIFRNDKYLPINDNAPINAFYDPHKKVTWIINKNGAIVNRGYCTLDSIDVDDNRKITYNLTLYGGIGEFFYSLAYNDNDPLTGTPKTLKDVYFGWRPKTSLIGYGNPLSRAEEMTDTLMRCSADIVTQAYHNLNPYYQYDDVTDFDKDVVFVPCYTGLYNDFDSKHMLVSTFNQNYAEAPLAPAVLNDLRNTFPDRVNEDGQIVTSESTDVVYHTMNKSFNTGGYTYGLATFSRDLDPTEAGDLRVNELPVAIRLSKLLWAITQPENCGGYEVKWSNSILQSPYFLYGWVLLGKLQEQVDNTLAYDVKTYGTQMDLYYDRPYGVNTTTSSPVPQLMYQSQCASGTYTLKQVIHPTLTFAANTANRPYITEHGFMTGASNHRTIHSHGESIEQCQARYSVYVVFTKVTSSAAFPTTSADLLFFSSDDNLRFGNDPFNTRREYIDAVAAYLQQYYNLSRPIDRVTLHTVRPNISSMSTSGSYDTYICDATPVTIQTTFENVTNATVQIEQDTCVVGIQWNNAEGVVTFPAVGAWGDENPTPAPYVLSFLGYDLGDYRTGWTWGDDVTADTTYTFGFSTSDAGIYMSESIGYDVIDLDKKTLFASTQSPFRYLVDFCKMMNYKFVCDNTKKHINIVTSDEYYKDTRIDLNGKVDYARQINIKPVIAKSKIIDVGPSPLDTYPVGLLNRKLDYTFNTEKFDTGLGYSVPNSSLLDDLIYKATADWQLRSIFYNIYPQYPKPYALPSVSWTLFRYEDDVLSKKEFQFATRKTTSVNQLQSTDWLPKIGMFDKSNAYVDGTVFMFLNGFVKNFDYKPIGKEGEPNYAIYPRLCFSNDTPEQYYLNEGQRCYMADFKYNDNFPGWGSYSSDQKGTATSWVLPMFSRDLYNLYDRENQAWGCTPYKIASWNFIDQAGLDTVIDLCDTEFIYRTNFAYGKTTNTTTWESNCYKLPNPTSVVADSPVDLMRIYNTCWERQLKDIYDRNAREVTLYVDLSQMSDVNTILRQTYLWEGSKWIITKIHDFRVDTFKKDKFTKVTMKKVVDINAWVR